MGRGVYKEEEAESLLLPVLGLLDAHIVPQVFVDC
jgi:hypothetical protein